MTPTKSARLVPCRDVVSAALDDEVVLCDGRSGEVFVLNSTGARIWALCDGTRTPSAIARTIAAKYGVGYRRALNDVVALVANLRYAGLLAEDL